MKIIPLIYCLFIVSNLFGQEKSIITGKVTNAQTGVSIANASVYIANTSQGSMTNTNGLFELKNIPSGNYELVISCIGYTTKSFSFSSDKLPMKIDAQLQTNATELAAVTVLAFEKNGWEKWGHTFLDNFIGTSSVARLVNITNFDVIRFRFSTKDNTLTASANETLLIENPALGYRIKYDLDKFIFDTAAHTTFFQGHCLFEDMFKDSKKITKRLIKNRKEAYQGSMMHFMRSLYNKKLVEEGFEVHKAAMNKKGFLVTSQALLTSDSIVFAGPDSSRLLYFKSFLSIMYKNAKADNNYVNPESGTAGGWRQFSVINLQSEKPVTIGYNGNYTPPLNIFSQGYWAWNEKIGHLLPLDYDEKTKFKKE